MSILGRGCGRNLLLLWFLLTSSLLLVAVAGVESDAVTEPVLTDEHCGICHKPEAQILKAEGGLHLSAIGCQDCHLEHPPNGQDAIPECSMCHMGDDHYELENCSGCHSNAHAPLKLILQGELIDACLTCHPQQGSETSQHPSFHAELACNYCHEEHRYVPSCMDCHEGHTEEMNQQSCMDCHPAHMPLNITYGENIPTSYCTSCHDEAGRVLDANDTKHSDFSCVFCHRGKHRMIPHCYSCHGTPHPPEMMEKFPTCAECHGTAHDLRR